MKSAAPVPRSTTTRLQTVIAVLEEHLGEPLPPKRPPPSLETLIATILSQNTDDRNSHRAYQQLRRQYPSWEDVLAARTSSVAKAIRAGGLAEQKSRCIKAVLTAIRTRFGTLSLNRIRTLGDDEVIDMLCAIKGIGLKTAACVLLFSLRRNICPVDTHVHRISSRLGLNASATTAEKTFHALRPLVPGGKAYSLHVNLIRFGRMICRSANPACDRCPLFDMCLDPIRHEPRTVKPPTRDVNFMILTAVR